MKTSDTSLRSRRVRSIALGLIAGLFALAFVAGCRSSPVATSQSGTAVPWAKGELTRLAMADNLSGEPRGSWEMKVGLASGVGAWVLTDDVEFSGGSQSSTVVVDAGLRPLTVSIHIATAEADVTVEGVYEAGKLRAVRRKAKGETKEFEIDLPEPPYYDNEQFVITLRTLPLASGWSATLPDVVTQAGILVNVPVKVTRRETVTVPAGTFDCWVVSMPSLGQDAWIAVEAPHQIVQYSNGGTKTIARMVEYRSGN